MQRPKRDPSVHAPRRRDPVVYSSARDRAALLRVLVHSVYRGDLRYTFRVYVREDEGWEAPGM